MGYEVTFIRSQEDLRDVLPAWEEFLTSPVCGSNLLNDPTHIDLLLAAEPDHSPHIILVSTQGRIRCIAPFLIRQTRFRLQFSLWTLAALPIRMLKLMGDQFVYSTEVDRQACFDAVFGALRQERHAFDLMFVHTLDCSGSLWKYCSAFRTKQSEYRMIMASPRMESVHQIKLPETHAAYLASLNPKTRQNLRRTTRKLAGSGETRMTKVTGPEQVPAFLQELDTVLANSWQAKTFGHQHRNTKPQLHYFEQLARCGWLRSYLLMHGDSAIAYELGFQYRNTYYGQDCGYDQHWKDWGPGSILMYMVIEDLFHDDRPDLLDFGLGDAPYKRSFGNHEHPAASFYIAPPNRWRRLVMVQQALNLAFLSGRTALVKTGLDNLVRRILKHKT